MLFQDGKFKSAAGIMLPFKIDCDALTDEDLACIAKHVDEKIVYFQYVRAVMSVPSGGDRFAAALQPYCRSAEPNGNEVLLVDDVWTTGSSMLKVAAEHGLIEQLGTRVKACVLFARGSHPHWVKPVLTLHPNLRIDGDIWRSA